MKKFLIHLFPLVMSVVGYSQQCEMLAKYGVYDSRTLAISRERAISYLNFFKRDTKMTYEEAKSYSATVGIPIETVMVNLGFSASTYGYQQFLESIINMTTYDEIFVENIVAVSRIINKDLMQVLSECYKQPGIHARMEITEDPQISFLVLKFSWEGNHSPVPIEIIITDPRAVSFNGETSTSGKRNLVLNTDEERRIPIKQMTNSTVGFSVRVKRQSSGGTVIVRSSNLVLFRQKDPTPSPSRVYKVERVESKDFRTSPARWSGGGDEELKRFETTELDGMFSLGLAANKLTGNFQATITEVISDNTQFTINSSVDIYSAPEGWRVAGFGVENEPQGSSISKFGPIRQSKWVSDPLYIGGPILFYTWQGDTGRDRDQIEGCWIQIKLKNIVVLLEKI